MNKVSENGTGWIVVVTDPKLGYRFFGSHGAESTQVFSRRMAALDLRDAMRRNGHRAKVVKVDWTVEDNNDDPTDW